MIRRDDYLNELSKWRHDDLIKVVTGIRRCGKSTLLNMYIERLKDEGVRDEQIIYINFEDLRNEELLNYRSLNSYVMQRLCKNDWTYIFLDEVQNVPMFEKVVDSLYIQKNTDIYITGSNAYMLSGELATLLSGRYIEISMLPLSFKEFYQAHNAYSKDEAFSLFLKNGGFPYISEVGDDTDTNKGKEYVAAIYNAIIIKDILERQRRRDYEKVSPDASVLESIAKYMASVVGNFVSINNIANYLVSSGKKISNHTVDYYVRALCEAFFFYSADRYDIRGKELLKTNKKYYIADLGLRSYLINPDDIDTGMNVNTGFALENVVFLELLRRHYTVNVGKYGDKEVDFVARKGSEIQYIQVSVNLMDKTTYDREIAPLRLIRNNFPKIILTMDKFTEGNYGGIIVKNVVNWLLENG